MKYFTAYRKAAFPGQGDGVGDLKGITSKLDYLQELGVELLWSTPFFPSPPDKIPTNWVSKFGGPAWEYVPSLGKWYLHLFDVTQADLNWENPEVREELKNVLRFWKTKGIQGFRFEAEGSLLHLAGGNAGRGRLECPILVQP